MIRYLTIGFLSLISTVVLAQNATSSNMIQIASSTPLDVYNRTLERLIESPYFLESADKESKLLKCKFVLKDNRMFSGRVGEIIHYNILFKNSNDGSTLVYIQANLTEKSKSGGVEIRDYYNDDLGITTDKKYIDPLFQFIRNGFEE